MARYKKTETEQELIIPVNLYEQLIPGTYEYTLNDLIDNKIDLRVFDLKYNNDITGAKATEPHILLKIILACYNTGIISSRKISFSATSTNDMHAARCDIILLIHHTCGKM